METFNISKITDFKSLHRIVCDHWGLDPKDYEFFDDNGDILEDDDVGGPEKKSPVDKVMENVLTRELKDKELYKGTRKIMLYLGNKEKFEERFKRWIKLKRDKFEEEKKLRQFQAGKGGDEEEEVIVEKDELAETEEFLQQFPGMKGHFKRNMELQQKLKMKGKSEDDIKWGGWLPPTCCSMLVNFI